MLLRELSNVASILMESIKFPVAINQGSEASGTGSRPSEAINDPVSRACSISGYSRDRHHGILIARITH